MNCQETSATATEPEATFNTLPPENAMNQLVKSVRQFLTSEDGPTAVEYAVMLALIVIVCLTAISAIGTRASSTFQSVADTLGSSS